MNNLFSEIQKKDIKSGLKSTETKDGSKVNKEMLKKQLEETNKIREVTGIMSEEDRRKYFFESGVDGWYDTLKEHTFPTSFIDFSFNEGQLILDIFRNKKNTNSLQKLEKRLDNCIKRNHNSSAFIKLSTRSPKDSTSAYTTTVQNYKKINKQKFSENERWICFSELLRQSFKVKNGNEAIELLTTSERVVEDVEFALKGKKKDDLLELKLVVRSFDEFVLPSTEFRGFVWKSKLTCVSQSFYKVYFEELQGKEKEIEKDLLTFFEIVKPNVKSPCYVIDLVWFPDGKKPLLVEVNPFDGEGLGTFPCSTGLFDWEKDRKVMTGESQFELRMRNSLPSSEEMKTVDPSWAKVVLE